LPCISSRQEYGAWNLPTTPFAPCGLSAIILKRTVGRSGFPQGVEADGDWTIPTCTLWCLERIGQAADTQILAKAALTQLLFLGLNLVEDSRRGIGVSGAFDCASHEYWHI
jgi:hypothetical protein